MSHCGSIRRAACLLAAGLSLSGCHFDDGARSDDDSPATDAAVSADRSPAIDAPPPAVDAPAPTADAVPALVDAGSPTPDAAPPVPDAAPPTPDSAPPTPDSAPPTPDAPAPVPDAAPAADASPTLHLLLNVNGPAHVGVDFPGLWAPDPGAGGVCGPDSYNTAAAIRGTADDPLFQGERFGNPLVCSLGGGVAPPGLYRVTLYFAEIFWGPGCEGGGTGAGVRVFDIQLEGNTVEQNVDLFLQGQGCAASSLANRAHPVVKTYDVSVTDGTLDISMPASADNAKISAIEIQSLF